MIEVYLSNGTSALVNILDISTTTETGASSQWHGVKCIIFMKSGARLEVNESYSAIKHRIEKAHARSDK